MRHLCYVRICVCAVSTKVENVALCEQSEQLDERFQIPAQPVWSQPFCMSTSLPACWLHDDVLATKQCKGMPCKALFHVHRNCMWPATVKGYKPQRRMVTCQPHGQPHPVNAPLQPRWCAPG